MPTHNIQVTEEVHFDPNDRAPWIFNAPTPTNNGDYFSLNATTFAANTVTLNATGGVNFSDPQWGPTPLTQVVGSMAGDQLNFVYSQPDNVWRIRSTTGIETQGTLVRGNPASFTPGSSFTAVGNWPLANDTPLFADKPAVPATGILTPPRDGIYRLNAQLNFQQGNTNKELAVLLWVRFAGTTDVVIDSLQVSDDKTDFRSLGATYLADLVANETVQLGLSWVNESLGSCTFGVACTFGIELVSSGLWGSSI